jgi:hypothetical protein
VKEVPFCGKAYGCAFDEILTDLNSIYIKIDDDIIFIKDGSFEHLVYQVGAGVPSVTHTEHEHTSPNPNLPSSSRVCVWLRILRYVWLFVWFCVWLRVCRVPLHWTAS